MAQGKLEAIFFCIAATCVPAALVAQEQEKPAEEQERTALDRLYDSTTKLIQDTADRFDNFFVTDEYATHRENATRVRLRLNADYIDNHGWDVSPNVKLHLALPRIDDRLRVVLNDSDDDDENTTAVDSSDSSDLALRWVFTDTAKDKLGISFDAGLRVKDDDLAAFGRINASKRYALGDRWRGNTSNRLYYYSDTGVRNDFRQYFDYRMDDHLLFRSRTRVQYLEENQGNPSWEQKFTIFHKLSDKHAIAYEALVEQYAAEDSAFDPDEISVAPKEKYYGAQVRLRYRRNLWRPWLYAELWPVLLWPEERDYDTTWAVRFRIEINFGKNYESAQTIDE